jgi:transcriptional regulator CtsR
METYLNKGIKEVIIAKTIYPDREIEIPKVEREIEETVAELKYSPPMKKLVDEHVLIKRWLALIPAVVENLDVESAQGRELILDGVISTRTWRS